MSAARDIAQFAVDNIEALLADMFEGDYANNEVSLGVLLSGGEEIQVQLKVTRAPSEFIDTEYHDWDASHRSLK
ncbi:hypothetical protein [Pseudoalteromonas rubra]|uniref:hypothetical protein n=1 Tax=Pseudoalteromonas rubra TaxID=43658 RepID=UPI000F7ADFB8|nr:hypothetical protein [Pseudoalteromonas rubra]